MNTYYKIEKILYYKYKRNKKIYFVKFIGYPNGEWVESKNITGYSKKDLKTIPSAYIYFKSNNISKGNRQISCFHRLKIFQADQLKLCKLHA